ncbi:MAG: hypothetical protein IJI66_09800 [Erysipelotrichaceae bacterium]|nr:hypothetical protein [Erysipelotrichaceae bacterium]
MASNEQGKKAQEMIRKGFFGECYKAINNGYYLEAMILEYASMEARARVILRELNMPCSTCEDMNILVEIGLGQKMTCLKEIYAHKNEYPDILGKSKLTSSTFGKIERWTQKRNERIHRLFWDVDKYPKLKAKNEKYAKMGMEYATALYGEANRLKNLRRRHPEYFENCSFLCQIASGGNLKPSCVKAKQWRPNENEDTQ